MQVTHFNVWKKLTHENRTVNHKTCSMRLKPPTPPQPLPISLEESLTQSSLKMSDEKDDDWEGCLSVPGLRGVVPRYSHIRYTGFDHLGNAIERDAHGFHARVVQHECDHLDGILYPQRMMDMRLFGFNETLEAMGQLSPMPCDTAAD